MKTVKALCSVFLMMQICGAQAQTEVITNTKQPWEMTPDEIADVTCTSYRNRALASYSAFGDQIPTVAPAKYDELKAEEDRIFNPEFGTEAERRASYNALSSKRDFLPYKMRENLGAMLISASDYDVLATSSVQKAVGALIAAHNLAARLPSMQKYLDDFVAVQLPNNYSALQQSFMMMTDTTLKYENCLALYIVKMAK